jgi:hypothetical protein
MMLGGSISLLSRKGAAFDMSHLATPPSLPDRMIEFEALGGVGDGDLVTGRGTDNASAFARAEAIAKQGCGVKFKSNSFYKTTKQINFHNMYWIGDEKYSPTIFGWFDTPGKKIIGRSIEYEPNNACIIGLTFHRCGPHAEHGIVIDNISSIYFDICVTSNPGSQGGAIGISPFFPENRKSRNCFIKAKIENSGDYGVQLGAVNGAIMDITANNCYREVIGIEPIICGMISVVSLDPNNSNLRISGSNISTGDPLICLGGEINGGGILPGKHYFAIKNSDGTISLADNRLDSLNGRKVSLNGNFKGYRFAKSSIVENVEIRSATITDDVASKPTLYANTRGYVIFTGNSGGYLENINIENITVVGNQVYNTGSSIGIYIQGVQNLTVRNVHVIGCDDAIVVRDGWLNGLFDENGDPIKVDDFYARLVSKKIYIIDPVITNFRKHGIVFQGSDANLVGGKLSSSVRNSKLLVRM